MERVRIRYVHGTDGQVLSSQEINLVSVFLLRRVSPGENASPPPWMEASPPPWMEC